MILPIDSARACPSSRANHQANPEDVNGAAVVLLSQHEPAVQAAARRRSRCPASRDAIAQASRLAILRAADGFDEARGVPFDHYVNRAIANAATTEAAKITQDQRRDLEIARVKTQRGSSGKTIGRANPIEISQASPSSPGQIAIANETNDQIRSWTEKLSEPLRAVFIELYLCGYSQREASVRLGISQPRVSQIHRDLLRLGRKELAELN